jgi:hypothetical protein
MVASNAVEMPSLLVQRYPFHSTQSTTTTITITIRIRLASPAPSLVLDCRV